MCHRTRSDMKCLAAYVSNQDLQFTGPHRVPIYRSYLCSECCRKYVKLIATIKKISYECCNHLMETKLNSQDNLSVKRYVVIFSLYFLPLTIFGSMFLHILGINLVDPAWFVGISAISVSYVFARENNRAFNTSEYKNILIGSLLVDVTWKVVFYLIVVIGKNSTFINMMLIQMGDNPDRYMKMYAVIEKNNMLIILISFLLAILIDAGIHVLVLAVLYSSRVVNLFTSRSSCDEPPEVTVKEAKIICVEDIHNVRLASKVERIGTYIYDLVFIGVFYCILALSGGILCHIFSVENLFVIVGKLFDNNKTLFIIILSLLYYVPQEALSGKTIGKRIMKTKVVNEDGSRVTLFVAFIRTLCRFIPFDQFSFIFPLFVSDLSKPIGWHDKLSKTKVISYEV
jgi:uncharacterized RDD family membrane protein YckC